MRGIRSRLMGSSVAATALMVFAQASPAYAQEQTYTFDIRAQALGPALRAFARTSRQQVTFDLGTVEGKRAPALKGAFTARGALDHLLSGTGLVAERGSSGLFIVRQAPSGTASSQSAAGEAASSSGEELHGTETVESSGAPEILVVGRRTINTDIRRSEDAAQPYVVFDRAQIEAAQADTIDDFFRTRLPMNAVQQSRSQEAFDGTSSSVNLRGLGSNQTLLLLDGRRLPSQTTAGGSLQPDLNGIPMGLIERIEILPSTASGIHGGGATGGVINIITRKDYTGLEGTASYGLTSRGDARQYRFDVLGGASLFEGQTQVVFSGSHFKSAPLATRDRLGLFQKSRGAQLENNPDAFLYSGSGGVPPTGAATNIQSADGSNLVLDGGAELGSAIVSIPAGYQAGVSDPSSLLATAGRFNLDFSDDPYLNPSLVGGRETNALGFNIRQKLSSKVDLYGDVAWFQNIGTYTFAAPTNSVTLAADNPLNPFKNDILVAFPVLGLPDTYLTDRTENLRLAAGAIVRITDQWSASLDLTWSKSSASNSHTINPLGDPDGSGPMPSIDDALANGDINPLNDLYLYPIDYSPYFISEPTELKRAGGNTLRDVSLRVTGPLFALPGGDLSVSLQANWRQEKQGTSTVERPQDDFFYVYPGPKQEVIAGYIEARMPLISPDNHSRFGRVLELQASVRGEKYSTTQYSPTQYVLAHLSDAGPTLTALPNEVESVSYTVAGKYEPFRGLMVRASYGTGFLPPSTTQLAPQSFDFPAVPVRDPKRGGQLALIGPVLLTCCGNPTLSPERSESLSAGFVLNPTFMPDFRFSVDYTKIRKTNEIASLSFQSTVDLEDSLQGRIVRAPLTPADSAAGYTGGAITAIDFSFVNFSRTKVEAWDFQGDYTFETGIGRLAIFAVATYQPTLARQVVPTDPILNSAGFSSQSTASTGVLKWRGNAGFNFTSGALGINWNTQIYDSYKVYSVVASPEDQDIIVQSQGRSKIPAQTYHDLSLSYKLPKHGALSAEIRFTVQNLFDKFPPVLASPRGVGSESYSTYGDPRGRRFLISVKSTL